MGLVNPSQSNPGDTIEASDINNPVNQLAAVLNGSIDSSNLASSAVTSTGLADGAVGPTKLTSSAIKLGYAQITANFVSANTASVVPVTGLSATVTIPNGGRSVKLTAFGSTMYSSTTSNAKVTMSLWDGTVGTGTLLAAGNGFGGGGAGATVALAMAVITPSAGSKTYNVGLQHGGGAGITTLEAGASFPAFILVEAI